MAHQYGSIWFRCGRSALLAGALLAPAGLMAADKPEEVPVVTGLDAEGMSIGFDPKGNNVRSFKIGNAVVTATLKKDGAVGIKVAKGTLTLTAPTGEPLATLTEGDDIEIDGFLETAKMFELLHGNDSQVLRLGSMATAAFTNLGPRPVNLNINNQAFVVGSGGGRQDAALGAVYKGTLPRNILTNLKPGQTVIGEDDTGSPLAITRDRNGKTSRKQLDANEVSKQEKRAGNQLQDARKLKPILGVPIQVKLDKTTVEITGTKDGAIVKVIDGPPLTLGTANTVYIGDLPVGSEIEIAGLTIPDGEFFTPVKKSVLLLPVTANYNITNRSDNQLTLGKKGELVTLPKNGKTTGTKAGYSTSSGLQANNLKQYAAGTGVEITNDKGEKIFVVVGDPLNPKRNDPTSVTIYNTSGNPVSLESFGLGNFVCGPGGGLTVPANNFNLVVNNGKFQMQTPTESLNNIRNAGKTNSVLVTKNGLLALQGNNSVTQSQQQQGKSTLTAQNASKLLGNNLPGHIVQMLNNTAGSTNNPPLNNTTIINQDTTKKDDSNTQTLTQTSGGGTITPFVPEVDDGLIDNGSITSATP